MKLNKKFKLYTHHHHFLFLGEEQKMGIHKSWLKAIFEISYHSGLVVLGVTSIAAQALYFICYTTGNFCLKGGSLLLKFLADQAKRTRRNLNIRIKKAAHPQFATSLMVFLLIALASSGGFWALNLAAQGFNLKDRILNAADLGSRQLTEAQQNLKRQDLAAAQANFLQAYHSFNTSKQELQATGKLANQMLNVLPQKREAEKILEAATLISQSGTTAISTFDLLSGLKLTAEGLSSPEPPGVTLKNVKGNLGLINGSLTKASELVESVDPDNLPDSTKAEFLDMKEKLLVLHKAFGNFYEIFGLLENLTSDSKNILVLFENNNELRATGGFIGTFGNLKINEGAISKINISSVYDLDGQLREKIYPPTPMLNVNDRWYLRDANWFADFPLTSSKITGFYEKEGGETPDIIVAVTPNLITELLKITGPVEMKNYGVTLDDENFVEMIQAVSTFNQMPVNSPKQVLADFFPVFLQKLGELKADQWAMFLEILQRNLNSKQLVIYSRNQALQEQLAAFHWTGQILPADRDYLSIVNSNLGGTKTDLSMEQQVDLKVNINAQGEIVNELTITRTNKMPKLEHSENISFVRIFVPEGSVLVSNSGFDYKNFGKTALEGYKNDPSVYEWEKKSVHDTLTGTLIGKESGKTIFGNWLVVQGNESKTVKLVYKLPFKLARTDRYSLLLQKQIGSLDQRFNLNLQFPERSLEWKNFETVGLEVNSLRSEMILNSDKFIGAVLKKR